MGGTSSFIPFSETMPAKDKNYIQYGMIGYRVNNLQKELQIHILLINHYNQMLD